MEHYNTNGNDIVFALNPPTRETSYLSEDFNFRLKEAYITSGIQEMLDISNEVVLQIFLTKVFAHLKITARNQKLDYLQKIQVNGIDTWLIDDGNTICWMRKEEY